MKINNDIGYELAILINIIPELKVPLTIELNNPIGAILNPIDRNMFEMFPAVFKRTTLFDRGIRKWK